MPTRKCCFVPQCKNTSTTAPEKIFITVPINKKRRKNWFAAARRALWDVSQKSVIYCCEDHFNFKEDMDNYLEYKLSNVRARMKEGVVPHIFACQPDKGQSIISTRPMTAFRYSKRVEFLNENSNEVEDIACSSEMPMMGSETTPSNTMKMVEVPALDIGIHTWDISTCRTSKMADNNGTDLNLLNFHIEEECSPANIKVEEVDTEMIKTETEVFGGSWVPQNVYIKEMIGNENGTNIKVEMVDEKINKTETEVFGESCVHHCIDNKEPLGNENGNVEYSAEQNENPEECSPANIKVEEIDAEIIKTAAEVSGGLWVPQNVCVKEMIRNENQKTNLENNGDQLLTKNLVIKKVALEDDSNICEEINKLSACHTRKRKPQGGLVENAETSNQEEKGKLKLNCSYTAVREGQLLSHIKSHRPMEKLYYCSECSYASVRKYALLLHIKVRHTTEKPYKCNDCSYAAVQKYRLLYHILSRHTLEKPHKCNECSFAAVQKHYLISHIKRHHTINKSYNCNECSYIAAQKADLVYHIESHHALEKPYKCNECSHSAAAKSDLLTHIKSRHPMEKPYKCNQYSPRSYSSAKKK